MIKTIFHNSAPPSKEKAALDPLLPVRYKVKNPKRIKFKIGDRIISTITS
jgi:hypothetical protein